MIDNKNEIIYNNGEIELKVSIDHNTIWLNASDIANIFDVNRPAIVKHIGNIYKTEELDKKSTCSILEQLANDGKKRKINFYNLDMIISIGYRVNSKKATKFRQWANSVLKEYINNGYTINAEKITNERFVALENDVTILKETINIIVDNNLAPSQGIFYDGQIFDAHNFVSDLIRKAKNKIVLIDNYVDDTTLNLFSKNQNINVTIYTHTISKALKNDLEKYNKQYKPIGIQTNKNFHDRFLIIDDTGVYHIGASLKDLGKKVFGFSRMEIESINILEKLNL